MSTQAILAIIFGLVALLDFCWFVRLTWRNRENERWAKEAATLGLLMVGVFLYCVAMLLFIGIWAVTS